MAARGLDVQARRRLAGGRSNHVWRAGGLVIKLYEPCSGNPLFANDPLREVLALGALAGTGMVPSLVDAACFEGRQWLVYAHITGCPWQRDTGHVAQLLGRLHDQPVPPGLPAGVNGSAGLEAQTHSILDLCRGGAALAGLRPLGLVPPVSAAVFIHGDPVPGNLLAHDGTLALIDWQCPQAGDAAEDLALFLSPAMQLLYRGRALSQAEEDAFLAAYPDPRVVARAIALKPWFHWRMAAYCLWRAEQGHDAARNQAALEVELAALQSSRPRSA